MQLQAKRKGMKQGMNELQLISRQQPGIVLIDNFDDIKQSLAAVLSRYDGVVYSEDMLSVAKTDKKELSRLRKDIEERRKDIKRSYMQPYEDFADKVKALVAMIDEPLGKIDAFVKEVTEGEKAAKHNEIERYFFAKSASLGDVARQVFDSPAFFDDKWLNKTTSAKAWQTAVDIKITEAAQSLRGIQTTGGQHTAALVTWFLETLDTNGLTEYRDRLNAANNAQDVTNAALLPEDNVTGYKVFKLTGTAAQMAQIAEQFELVGLEYEEIEDGMPGQMTELLLPNFDTFVTLDIETTGTYGAANGDAPAEITEIAAVKVVGGEVVGKFSELVNPGRGILPRIARLTGITDAMVADKPSIESVIVSFADFVGGCVLVGHNIKSSDLYYIGRAAKKAGIRLENTYFDTYRYAKTLKTQQGWQKLNLDYLAQQFGIEIPSAHRAWCDAEANAAVYLKLQTMR